MHPKQAKLEEKLQRLCDELDSYLEDRYGKLYPLHPNRLPRGKAASGIYDGLFSTGTMFTLGYGSVYGRGYIIDVEIRTLSKVDPEDRERIDADAMAFLERNLKKVFPRRELSIVKDGPVYKLIGDFSLGAV
ncbi:MAG: hypothetical protein PHI83_07280 [Sphaerochaetaceae bacterium]|jgi:hypothetical protein|nr:hypothetical protein [Sphaerochaetaceae bacterium]